jgi:thiamine-phosphate pyrophosphorylase
MIDKLHYISQPIKDSSHLPAIEKALNAGCRWIQLRIKEQPRAFILEQALTAKSLCDAFQAKLIINDYPEVAAEVRSYGLHLGLQDLPIAQARSIVGQQMIIGGTANTFEQVEQRVEEGADYIGLGPYRFTSTKKNLSPILGLSGYQKIIHKMKECNYHVPLIAIGGITRNDVASIIKSGMYGIAVSGEITFAKDELEMVKDLQQALNPSTLNLKEHVKNSR